MSDSEAIFVINVESLFLPVDNIALKVLIEWNAVDGGVSQLIVRSETRPNFFY